MVHLNGQWSLFSADEKLQFNPLVPMVQKHKKKPPIYFQSWALLVFFHFFNDKNYFFTLFIKLITYFCNSPI